MITIRLEGTPAEVEAATAMIYKAFYVLEASENRKNRPPSDLVRRYLKVKSPTDVKQAHIPEDET